MLNAEILRGRSGLREPAATPPGMLIHRPKSRDRRESGIIITLIAIFLLFVVGAMAALSIDIVTFYTARSEAQLAADAAALAGARVLANSGVTSNLNATTLANALTLCGNFGTAVGAANHVAGVSLAGHITVTCTSQQVGNPIAKAQVQLYVPAFFARIWGTTQVSITASAAAEAYNPSLLASDLSLPPSLPVALSCVKPWLIPNLDPGNPANPIFAPTGAISATTLLGSSSSGMLVDCLDQYCTGGLQSPVAWKYYPGDTANDFLPPPSTSVACTPSTPGFAATEYQLAVAGCVQAPIACNATKIRIDLNPYPAGRDDETTAAVNCLTHSATNLGDTIDAATFPSGPFEFLVGGGNPVVAAGLTAGSDVVVSDSLVTVPVFDNTTYASGSNTVDLVGFVQLFLNPSGNAAVDGSPISTTVVNLVGCSSGMSLNPVYGNGATTVPVRLITPQ